MTGRLNIFFQSTASLVNEFIKSNRFSGELLRYLFVCMLMVAANPPESVSATPALGAETPGIAGSAQQQPSNVRVPISTPMPARPPLQMHQGQYFSWSVPTGWNARESTSGVEMSSPDGLLKADWAILLRSPGSNRPENFVLMMLPKIPGYSDIHLNKVLGHRQQPSIYPGLPWNVFEMDITYQYRGIPMRSTWTCGIRNVYGRTYDATISGYGASEGQFEQAKLWLWQVANSVTITNPRQVAGNDTVITPKNNPLDNRGLIESWRQKGLSEDRISQSRRESTMGYERMKDTSTGQKWNMPLESYDGAAGGYLNPNRPGELLQKAQPGE